MCPFNTVTEPNFLRYDNACALSSVPQPHSGYTDHKGMCANTTMGVLYCKGFTSSSNHSSCSWPSVPSPPAFRFSTFTNAMKCTPFLSKLYQPAPWAPLPKRSEEHTSELQSHSDLVCRLLLEKKNNEKLESSTR